MASHSLVSSMHEYKLQVQRASDLAMEKLIDQKNSEILGLKSSHNHELITSQNDSQNMRLERDTFNNQVQELEKEVDIFRNQLEHKKSELAQQQMHSEKLKNSLDDIQLHTEKIQAEHQHEIRRIVNDTGMKLQHLENTVQNRDKGNAEIQAKLQGELDGLTEACKLNEEHASNLKNKLDREHQMRLTENGQNAEKLLMIEKENNDNLNREREQRANEDARNMMKIKEIEQKLANADLICMDLREKLGRCEDRIVELQGEMEGLVEEADEKLTLLREEKEDALKVAKRDTENAITDIKERMNKEKELW